MHLGKKWKYMPYGCTLLVEKLTERVNSKPKLSDGPNVTVIFVDGWQLIVLVLHEHWEPPFEHNEQPINRVNTYNVVQYTKRTYNSVVYTYVITNDYALNMLPRIMFLCYKKIVFLCYNDQWCAYATTNNYVLIL